MSVFRWNLRERLDPDFAETWRSHVDSDPHSHFGFDLRYLQWEARHGRPGIAVLVCEESRHGAFVLREVRGRFKCGWPWRWHAIVCGRAPDDASGLAPAESAWLRAIAIEIASGRRLLWFEPGCDESGTIAFRAGSTVVRRVDLADEELLGSLAPDKRRFVRRAVARGYEVIEGGTPDQWRGFAMLQKETARRHGQAPSGPMDAAPAPGEGWREWELPWMWLLLAVRRGSVEAGSGFSVGPGAQIDYRANASTLEARTDGANVLLAYEALRRARDRGFRWMNWGGNTYFKREMGGVCLTVGCRLSGGARWAIPNACSIGAHLARQSLVGWRHALAVGARAARGRRLVHEPRSPRPPHIRQ